MGEYILRLFILLPLVGGLAYASLWLWRRTQLGLPQRSSTRAVRILDVLPLGQNGKMAVIVFGGRELLVAVSRNQITLIAESTHAPDA
jgi:flagellar protein FliO/FliZ